MASLIGVTSGVSFGIAQETGILVQSFSMNASSEKVEVKNHNGDVALVAYHNEKITGSVAGTIAGTSGVAAAAVASAISLANMQSLGGTSGTAYVDSVALSKGPDKFADLTVNFTIYPNLGQA